MKKGTHKNSLESVKSSGETKSNEHAKRKASAKADPAQPSFLTEETNNHGGVVSTPASGVGFETNGMAPIETLASGIDGMEISTVEKEIGKACKQTAKHLQIAEKSSVLVASYAWITGKLILRAKSLLKKKGEFGDWCEKCLVVPGLMSVKTAQRYMALAKKWDSLGAMLAVVPNLWSAYQAAGVVPVPCDDDDSDGDADPADDLANTSGEAPVDILSKYLAGFSKLQKSLRHLVQMREEITAGVPEADQDMINEIIDQVIEFANKLRGKAA